MPKERTILKNLKDEIVLRLEFIEIQQQYLKELLSVLEGVEVIVSRGG